MSVRLLFSLRSEALGNWRDLNLSVSFAYVEVWNYTEAFLFNLTKYFAMRQTLSVMNTFQLIHVPFHLILTEKCHETDAVEPIMCPPWSTRLSKLCQPNLDFTAPEIQTCSNCSILSDMFSLGLVICTIFNNGKPLIQAQNTPSAYLKQLEMVSWIHELKFKVKNKCVGYWIQCNSNQGSKALNNNFDPFFIHQLDDAFQAVLPKIPLPLQEATTRLVSKQPGPRPTAQLLQLIKYFKWVTLATLWEE